MAAAARSAGAAAAAVAEASRPAVRRLRQVTNAISDSVITTAAAVKADERSSAHSALQSSSFSILDVYSASSEADVAYDLQRVEAEERRLRADLEASRGSRGCIAAFWLRLKQRFVTFTTAPSSWVFLVVLGFLAAIVAYLVDAPVAALARIRFDAVARASAGAGFFIWVFWCLALSLVAAGIVHLIPLSEGSGIPQLKSILAGTSLGQYLSLRVAVAKMTGLIAAQAAGLSVGKEGPFVHISAALAGALVRLQTMLQPASRHWHLSSDAGVLTRAMYTCGALSCRRVFPISTRLSGATSRCGARRWRQPLQRVSQPCSARLWCVMMRCTGCRCSCFCCSHRTPHCTYCTGLSAGRRVVFS